MVGMIVECWDIVKHTAASILKRSSPLVGDFFQGFQAIHRKSGTNDIQARYFFPSNSGKFFIGVGGQPFLRAKARLKGQGPSFKIQVEALRYEDRSLLTLGFVRITGLSITARDAMKRE